MWGGGRDPESKLGILKRSGVLAEASTQIGADGFAWVKKLVPARVRTPAQNNENIMCFGFEIS
jgi:hypothetical protein